MAQGGVIIDIGEEIGLLVVGLEYIVEFVFPYDTEDSLAFEQQLVHIDLPVLVENIVDVEETHHLVERVGIHNAVVEFLVIAQRTVVDADVLYLYIGLRTFDGDVLRRVLLKAEGRVIDVGAGAVAVDVEFHQATLCGGAYYEGDLLPIVGIVFGGELDVAGHLLVVFVGVCDGLSGAEARLGGGHEKSLAVVDAAYHRRGLVGYVADTHCKFKCQSPGLDIGGKRFVADSGPGSVCELECSVYPSAALPVEAFKCRSNTVRLPLCRVGLAVAASGGIELELQTVGGLAYVNAALGDIDGYVIARAAGLEGECCFAFLGEPVRVVLHCPRYGGSAFAVTVAVYLDDGRGDGRVVGHEVEGTFLVLADGDLRSFVCCSLEYASVLMGSLDTYKGA